MEFGEIALQRYATKKFDGKQLPKEKLDALFELIRYSASSFGLQPYKIVVVKDHKMKEKIAPAAWNQPQITTCSHLLVFCGDDKVLDRINGYEKLMRAQQLPEESIKGYVGMMRGFAEGLSTDKAVDWAKKQCYIALGNAINGAKALGFDSCPMEGFSPDDLKKILKLPENLHPTAVVAVGYAADTPRPKIRYSRKDLFIE